MPVALEGGTEEQRALLRSILAGLDTTQVEAIGLEAWGDRFEEHASLGLVPTTEEIEASRGTALRLLRPREQSIRVQWEIEVAAAAFRARSADHGLEQVVVLHRSDGTMWLRSSAEAAPSLAPDRVERMCHEITTAVAEARADLLDLTILRPAGRAWAVSVGVAEPHAFLRERFRPLLESLEPWAEACGWQSYIEIRDSERQPALVRARSLSGMSQVRPDVRCCSPLLTRGAALFAPPAPPCPVFGRDVGCCRRLPP